MSDEMFTARTGHGGIEAGTFGWMGAAVFSAALLSVISNYAPAMVYLLAAGLIGAAFVWISVRRPEIGIVGLVAAAALDVTGRIAEVGGAGITVYQGAVALFGIATLLRMGRSRTSLRPTVADVPLALMLAFAFAAIPAALNPTTAFVQFVSMLSSVALVYFVVLSVDNTRQLEIIIWGTLAVAATLGFFAVLERYQIFAIGEARSWYGYGVRAKTTFKDPNIFGSFLAAALGLSLPLVIAARKTPWLRLAAAAGWATACVGLLFTFSRGALMALAIAVVITLLFARIPAWVRIGVIAAGALLVAVFLIYYADPAFLNDRILKVFENRSALYRVYMAKAALQMAWDNPMGIGLGNYPLLFPLYRPAFVLPTLVESHTAYLTVLVEVGVIGLGAFLYFIVRFLADTFRVVRRAPSGALQVLAVGSLAGASAVLAQSLTYSLETSKFLWLCFAMGIAVTYLYRSNKEDHLA